MSNEEKKKEKHEKQSSLCQILHIKVCYFTSQKASFRRDNQAGKCKQRMSVTTRNSSLNTPRITLGCCQQEEPSSKRMQAFCPSDSLKHEARERLAADATLPPFSAHSPRSLRKKQRQIKIEIIHSLVQPFPFASCSCGNKVISKHFFLSFF